MLGPGNQRVSDDRRFTLRARLISFGYAARGLCALVRGEHNAWLHIAATILVATAGSVLRIDTPDWRWLIVAAALVWMAEAINTAIEALCDRLHPSRDPAVGRVKDLAAGAVLVAAVAAALIGALTLVPYLLERGP
jgi:diacylglycerol kinase (ATP)